MKSRKREDLCEKLIDFFLKVLPWNFTDKTRHLLVQIFKFGIVGVVATFIDFIVLYGLKELFSFPVLVANTLSFSVSVLYNYWASKTFVFDVDVNKNQLRNFFIFIICSVIGLILNDWIVWFLTERFLLYYLYSKVIATLIVMIFNFITRKKFLE